MSLMNRPVIATLSIKLCSPNIKQYTYCPLATITDIFNDGKVWFIKTEPKNFRKKW